MRLASIKSSLILLVLSLGPIQAIADDSPLTLADLEAYRLALGANPDDPALAVKFRDLWDRPDAYVGRAVKVEGRVARIFRQGRVGEFPPLVEAWVVSPSGDPFCLIFPGSEGQPSPEIGSLVRFSGRFLKRIKYQGGDTPRVAPLLVGPRAPSGAANGSGTEGSSWTSVDWIMASGGMLVVVMILLGRHVARPAESPSRPEPPPAFIDGKADRNGTESSSLEGWADEDNR